MVSLQLALHLRLFLTRPFKGLAALAAESVGSLLLTHKGISPRFLCIYSRKWFFSLIDINRFSNVKPFWYPEINFAGSKLLQIHILTTAGSILLMFNLGLLRPHKLRMACNFLFLYCLHLVAI